MADTPLLETKSTKVLEIVSAGTFNGDVYSEADLDNMVSAGSSPLRNAGNPCPKSRLSMNQRSSRSCQQKAVPSRSVGTRTACTQQVRTNRQSKKPDWVRQSPAQVRSESPKNNTLVDSSSEPLP